MSRDRRQKARNWVFTIKHYLEEDVTESTRIRWDPAKFKYLAYQCERAPETGGLHLQGYVQFNVPVHFSTVQNTFGVRNWYDRQRAPLDTQAADYALKPDTRVAGPFTHGEMRRQGQRSDLASFVSRIQEGASPSDLLEEFPGHMLRFNAAVQKVQSANYKPAVRPVKVLYCHGPTGCGKSRAAAGFAASHGSIRCYHKPPGEDWWDNYSGEPVVIWDEFHLEEYTRGKLLMWLDQYPVQLPVKNAFVPAQYYLVILLTQDEPGEWLDHSHDRRSFIEAFKRRVQVVDASEWHSDTVAGDSLARVVDSSGVVFPSVEASFARCESPEEFEEEELLSEHPWSSTRSSVSSDSSSTRPRRRQRVTSTSRKRTSRQRPRYHTMDPDLSLLG